MRETGQTGKTVTVSTSTGVKHYTVQDSFNDPPNDWTIDDIMEYIDNRQENRINDLNYGIAIGVVIGAVITMAGLMFGLYFI